MRISCATVLVGALALGACSSSGGGSGVPEARPVTDGSLNMLVASVGRIDDRVDEQGAEAFIERSSAPAGKVAMSGNFAAGAEGSRQGIIGSMNGTADFQRDTLSAKVTKVREIEYPQSGEATDAVLGRAMNGAIDVTGRIVSIDGRAMVRGSAKGTVTGSGVIRRGDLDVQGLNGGFWRENGKLQVTGGGEGTAKIRTAQGTSTTNVGALFTMSEN